MSSPVPTQEYTQLLDGHAEISIQACRLVRIEGPGRTTEFELGGGETVVGTSRSADINTNDGTVSRTHFVVKQEPYGWLLRDLGSTNGTFVDEIRVKEAYLKPGTMIRAGQAFFRFELAYKPAKVEPSGDERFGNLLGKSLRMREIFTVLEKISNTTTTILLQGDTGTGKGAMARALHDASPVADGAFIVFDCGATAANLVESELFGHEKGAFTGAVAQRKGALEEATGGTLFIDELNELSPSLQPKLLRALEEREFTRVGSNKTIKLDCRVIAASQRDLWGEVMAERFRRDLYFRLAVVTIPIPSLHERREDIPLLVERFLLDVGHPDFKCFEDFDEDARRKMLSHDWPGNARELRNAIERMVVLGQSGDSLAFVTGREPAVRGDSISEIDYELPYKEAKDILLHAFEQEYLKRLKERSKNLADAARRAGIGRKHLYTLLDKHGLGDGGKPSDSEDA